MSMFSETIKDIHEYRHAADDTPSYNESSYYNFACPTSGVVGWLRVAMQPNQPAAQATVLLFLPDGETLFDHRRTTTVSPDELAAGSVAIDILEPHERQRLTFEGSLSSFSDPRALSTPKTAFRDAPRRTAKIELSVHGNGASFGTNGSTPGNVVEETMALGHYEQFTLLDGDLTIGDRVVNIRGAGLRDHSWGPRDWAGPVFYRWVTASFDDGSAIMALEVARRDGELTRRAAIVRDGLTSAAELTDIDMTWTDDGFCRSMRCGLYADGHELTLNAAARDPQRFVPLRHRRSADDGTELNTRIGYSAYEFTTSDGRRGLGIVEVLDQLVDGLPIGMTRDSAAGRPGADARA